MKIKVTDLKPGMVIKSEEEGDKLFIITEVSRNEKHEVMNVFFHELAYQEEMIYQITDEVETTILFPDSLGHHVK